MDDLAETCVANSRRLGTSKGKGGTRLISVPPAARCGLPPALTLEGVSLGGYLRPPSATSTSRWDRAALPC